MNDFIDDMARAYLACAWWADSPEHLAFTHKEATKATKKEALAVCLEFTEKAKQQGIEVESFGAEQVGHDFWLTRNGHGAGFWDRPEVYGGQSAADELTELARSFKEAYVCANGKYFTIGG